MIKFLDLRASADFALRFNEKPIISKAAAQAANIKRPDKGWV